MQQKGLKTGQAVIEFIINDYAQLQSDLKATKAKREAEKQNYYQWSNQWQEEIDNLKQVVKAAKVALKLINDTDI